MTQPISNVNAHLPPVDNSPEACAERLREKREKSRLNEVLDNPVKRAEAADDIDMLLSEPVSKALFEEVRDLVTRPGDISEQEATKICENSFRMNSLHRLRTFSWINQKVQILKLVMPTCAPLFVHMATCPWEEFVSENPNMPATNLDGADLVFVLMYFPKEESRPNWVL